MADIDIPGGKCYTGHELDNRIKESLESGIATASKEDVSRRMKDKVGMTTADHIKTVREGLNFVQNQLQEAKDCDNAVDAVHWIGARNALINVLAMLEGRADKCY